MLVKACHQFLPKRIQEGQFVEMVELIPDYLQGPNSSDEDQLKSSKFKNWEITNMVDWIKSFSIYITVVCRSQPQRIVDLMGHQNFIIVTSSFLTSTGPHLIVSSASKQPPWPYPNGLF